VPEQIGDFYPTQVPSYTEAADIRKAFNLYHYGTEEVPTSEGDIIAESMAGYIRDTLAALEAAEIGETVVLSLTSTDNLNFSDSVQSGIYKSAINLTNEQATTLNYPVNSLGLLNHVKTTDSTYFQTFISVTDNGYWWRVGVKPQVDVVWTSWQKAAESNHTHDTRYFTESEINAKLNMTTMTPSSAAIVDSTGKVTSSSSVTQAELETLSDISTATTIKTQLDAKAPLTHYHDERYYLRSDVSDPQSGAQKSVRVFVQSTQPTSPAVGDLWFW
jgi:hypothetical protein